jgi:hypothetical protein
LKGIVDPTAGGGLTARDGYGTILLAEAAEPVPV